MTTTLSGGGPQFNGDGFKKGLHSMTRMLNWLTGWFDRVVAKRVVKAWRDNKPKWARKVEDWIERRKKRND